MTNLFFSAGERSQLDEWNDTDLDYPGEATLPALFKEHATRTPNAVAVVADDTRLTYQELDELSNKVANSLLALGIQPGQQVIVHLDRTSAVPIAVLGVLKIGAAYVPMDAQQSAERLRHALSDPAAVAVLTDGPLGDRLPATPLPVIRLDDTTGADRHDPVVPIDADQVACLVYTSGSTGRPKGVLLTHGNLAGMYFGWQQAYELATVVRTHCQTTNFSFVVFQADLVRALGSGGTLVLCSLETVLDAAALYRTMRDNHVDYAEFVPAVLRGLIRHVRQNGSSLDFLKLLVVGSDRWYYGEHADLRAMCGPGTRVVHSFGLTETTVDSAYFEHTATPVARGELTPIGRPFPNVRLYVLDDNRQPVPVGITGELYVGGVGVTKGYRLDTEQTASRFVDDPFQPGARMYRTGDLARYLSDGNIQFLGRGDTQVKVRGMRVELGEIEVALRAHPGVRDAVVSAITDDAGNTRLVAYVTAAAVSLAPLARHHTVTLIDGVEVASLVDAETQRGHHRIFQEERYLRHGVTILPGDRVFDVGANIGLFSLFVHRHCADTATYVIEPAPDAYAALVLNLALHRANARPIKCALGLGPGSGTLRWYPRSTTLSTMHAQPADEKAVLRALVAEQTGNLERQPAEWLDGWLDERLRSDTHEVEVRGLAELMGELDVPGIDLLKITVHKGEADVLAGLTESAWPKIEQIVVESYGQRLDPIRAMLAERGFRVEVENDVVTTMLYAVRPDAGRRAEQARTVPALAAPPVSGVELRGYLTGLLHDHMVPAGFVFLDALPLTSTGKVDRNALPTVNPADLDGGAEFVAPRTDVELTLAAIWSEVLGVPRVGVRDDFYQLGGHSLLAMQVLSKARRALSTDIPLEVFLRGRTVEELAARISEDDPVIG